VLNGQDIMDALYVSILIAFFVLISALAIGCAHLQTRRSGPRPAPANSPTPRSARLSA
jgi:ABC-type spermidine/putrescine transport system permease subunit II